MGQSISEIRTDIEHTKENISQTVSELEDRFKDIRRIKNYKFIAQQYPLPTVAISFGVGILLGGGLIPLSVLSLGAVINRAKSFAGQILTASLTGILVNQLQQRFPGYKPE